MPALITDKFRLASGSTRPVVTSLSLPKAAGATTCTLTVATGWNTTTALDYVMYRRVLNTTTNKYEEVAGTRIEGIAILTGTTLSAMTIEGTEPASGYAADGNTVVLCAMTAQCWDDAVQAIIGEHNQDGSHKNSLVAMLAGAQTFTGVKTFTAAPVLPAASLPATVLTNPYKFSAYRSTALTSGAGVALTIIFNTENFDTGNNYDVATGKFTAPITGFYQFTAAVQTSVANTRQFINWKKNGVTYRRSTDIAASGFCSADSLYLQLAVTDTVEVEYFTAAATAVDNTQVTQFAGYLVSAA